MDSDPGFSRERIEIGFQIGSLRLQVWINGGYFIFRNRIFGYIQDSEELVLESFHR